MRHPDNRRDADLFEEIFSDPHRAAQALLWTLTIDGEPQVATDLRAYSEVGNPAFALEGSTPTPLDYRLERKRANVDLLIEGRPWREYRGRVVDIGEDEDGSGTFGAATAGYYQGAEDSIKFNTRTTFADRPDAAYRKMLAKFPYRRRKVPAIAGPDFIRQGEEAYHQDNPIGEAIDALEEESATVQIDRPLDVAEVLSRPNMGGVAVQRDVRRWTVGREVSSFSAQKKAATAYYDVGVLRILGGSRESLVNPRPRVRYPAGVEPPPVDVTYWHTISEESGERTSDARKIANTLLTVFRYGEHDVTFTTPFIDPRVEDYDVREVVRMNHETGEETLFRVLIEAQERDYVNMEATYRGTGVIIARRDA